MADVNDDDDLSEEDMADAWGAALWQSRALAVMTMMISPRPGALP